MTEKQKISPFLALLVLLLPILSPYAIGSFSLADILVAIGFVMVLANYPRINGSNPLVRLHILFAVLTIFAIGVTSATLNITVAFKVFIVFTLYLSFYTASFNIIHPDSFFRILVVIGLITASLAIIQFVGSYLGVEVYDGKLPLPMDKYSNVGSIILSEQGNFRVHSFFEEPSYLALYEIPIVYFCIVNKNYLYAAIIGLSCLVCGSMIGILGLTIVFIATLFMKDVDKKVKKYLISGVLLLITAIVYLYASNDAVQTTVNYFIFRYTNLDNSFDRADSSESERLIGNFYLFYKYPFINQLIGTGFNQYQFYFSLAKDYSNDFVSTLLNFGVVGIIGLLTYIFKLFKNTINNGRVLVLFFVIVLAVDHVWFNTYFFYLLAVCTLFNSYSKQHEVTNSIK